MHTTAPTFPAGPVAAPPKQSVEVPVARIRCSDPVRGSDAELSMLAESMKVLGQLQEIVLNSRYELVAGRRRLEAARRLRWPTVRAFVNPTFDDAIKALKAERDENCPGCRVPLSRAEQLELARRLEELENPEAARRKAASQAKPGKGKVGEGKFPEPDKKGQTRDKIGDVVGMSGRTLEKAQQVIASAQEHPDRYADLGQQVATDRQPIDPVYQEFKQRQEIYEAAEKDERFGPVAAKLTETHDTAKAAAEYERLRDEQGRDKVGTPLPKRLMRVFNRPWADEAAADIDRALEGVLNTAFRMVRKNGDDPYLPADTESAFESAISGLRSVRDVLMAIVPHAVCPKCKGDGCKPCRQSGWLTKEAWAKVKGK